MITENDIIQIVLTKQEVLECIGKAINEKYLDNLRDRSPNVQFDCKLRGSVGELAMRKWLTSNGISIQATNIMRDGYNIDIDFLIAGKNLELKTSLIPDRDRTLRNVINKRDIKIIRRSDQSIEQLKGDVHLQIYFKQRTKAKDDWLNKQKINLKSKDLEYLYSAFRADAYLNTTYFVAWIDKETLVKKINSIKEDRLRYWSFNGSLRQFWKCSLKDDCKPPLGVIDFLK